VLIFAIQNSNLKFNFKYKKMKILLSTDGSAHSKAMVKKFANRIFAPNTKVRIVSAYEGTAYMQDSTPMGSMSEYYTMVDKSFMRAAENATQNAAAVIQKKHPQLSISTIAIEGSPKNIILKEAEKFSADLIVVGSHGHGIVAGFLLGSVSQAVALHAKCSVEIVRK
jgi:nucleotide-binding universal stress UspA family protein